MEGFCKHFQSNEHCPWMELDNVEHFILIKQVFENNYPGHNVPNNGECPYSHYGDMAICPRFGIPLQ